ncbi:DMSO/selenate family reductase complex A subunit [Ancrocorticia populi]|uniref:DMSO/selenate family reductase complex A subunit n=1 Tax=Ancrocorticia populi TaxID=2175228 RepID=UPI003F9D6C96
MTETIEKPAGSRVAPSRRSFLKWSGVATGTATLLASSTNLGMPGHGPAAAADGMADADKTVWNACLANCQSRCPLRLQVKDGTVARILPDNTGSDELGDLQVRACVRGRNQRERIYSPDRLKKPMKRAGERGEDKWEEISWEEAFDTIASEMKRVKENYGNEALWYHYGSGSTGGNITKRGTWPRLLNTYGGYLGQYGDYSTAQITAAYPYFFGDSTSSNSLEDAQFSQLQVMFGNNPLETRMSGGGELGVVQKVRKDFNVKTIVIDPRYSETALAAGDEWVPLRPGTDAALVAGLIHVMIEEGLHDQDFLDKYCVGFDEDHMPDGVPENNSYRAYLEGKGEDGTEKTAEWAADITGVPADRIRQLAREIAGAKPAAITQGWGPQRNATGENSSRAIFLLAAATGNVGIKGGGTGAREGNTTLPVAAFPLFDGEEPPVTTQISCFNWIDAIDHGPEMTATNGGVRGKDRLDVGIKLMVVNASNTLTNQHNDLNKTYETLADTDKCEFIVVIDHQHTDSAKWADILLPSTTNFEEFDMIPGASCGDTGWVIWGQQAIDPLYDTKTGYEMCTEIAKRLGIEEEFTQGRTQEEWRQYLYEQSKEAIPDLPSADELEELGIWRKHADTPFISLKEFREDPEANPMPTDSGKLEIFSKQLYDMNKEWEFDDDLDRLAPLPEQVQTYEDWKAARADGAKYPLQLMGHHYKGRTHSSYANLPRNKEAHPQKAWVNPVDADERGIENGDFVDVFNDRGRMRIPALVTPRIAPGVVSVPQGAWHDPDKDGIDMGGCVNLLTKYHPSPLAKGNPANTALVEVEKYRG